MFLAVKRPPPATPADLARWRRRHLNAETGQPMTTADAAAYFGVSQRSYQRYEVGRVPGWLARYIRSAITPSGFHRKGGAL